MHASVNPSFANAGRAWLPAGCGWFCFLAVFCDCQGWMCQTVGMSDAQRPQQQFTVRSLLIITAIAIVSQPFSFHLLQGKASHRWRFPSLGTSSL